MDDLALTAGSHGSPQHPSASSSQDLPHLETTAPTLDITDEDLVSLIVLPDEWLITSGRSWRLYAANALKKAIQEIIQPVVDRSTTIAVISAMNLIKKDFSMESDESRIRTLAIQMATASADSLAQVTAREPLRTNFANYLRQLESPEVPVTEETIKDLVTKNLDVACTIVCRATRSRTATEMESMVGIELERRQTIPWKNSSSFVLSNWLTLISDPSLVDPSSRSLTQEQVDIYRNFSAIHAEPNTHHFSTLSESSFDPSSPATGAGSNIRHFSTLPESPFDPTFSARRFWPDRTESVNSKSITTLGPGKCHLMFLFI